MALLTESVEAGADDAEIFSAVECAKAAGYFLLHFGHTNGAFAKIVGKRDSRIMDKKQHGIGMLTQAAQQIEGNRLLATPTFAGRLGHFRILPLALAQNRIVERAESSNVFAGKCDRLLPRRLAHLVGVEQKVLHPLRPSLGGDFLHVDQLTQEMRVAKCMDAIELPVWRPAIMNQYAQTLGQNAEIGRASCRERVWCLV